VLPWHGSERPDPENGDRGSGALVRSVLLFRHRVVSILLPGAAVTLLLRARVEAGVIFVVAWIHHRRVGFLRIPVEAVRMREGHVMKVERGSLVWLDYDAFLDSGRLVGSSAWSGSLRVLAGPPQTLSGLGKKLIGLHEGEERLICLEPAQAFGDWNPDAVVTIRESRLAADVPLEDGMWLEVEAAIGLKATCRVLRIAEDRVALDFNHPLAGEVLNFFVHVRKVVTPGRHLATLAARHPSKGAA
jgi:FKBP-type peptidyl-prolyl cis-trans isomerase 2